MAQTVREILDSREREVRRLIDDIRERQLAPLERELMEIVIARSAILGIPGNNLIFDEQKDDSTARFMRMTYEELAREAFKDKFKNGATIGELLQHIRTEYGREISQGSFSPVLSRMRAAGTLEKMGKVWLLSEDNFESLLGGDGPQNEKGEAEASPDAEGVEGPSFMEAQKWDL